MVSWDPHVSSIFRSCSLFSLLSSQKQIKREEEEREERDQIENDRRHHKLWEVLRIGRLPSSSSSSSDPSTFKNKPLCLTLHDEYPFTTLQSTVAASYAMGDEAKVNVEAAELLASEAQVIWSSWSIVSYLLKCSYMILFLFDFL